MPKFHAQQASPYAALTTHSVTSKLKLHLIMTCSFSRQCSSLNWVAMSDVEAMNTHTVNTKAVQMYRLHSA